MRTRNNICRGILSVFGVAACCLTAVLADEAEKGGVTDQPAATQSPEAMAFFEQHVRPLLVRRCYECHSADAKEIRGGLTLHNRMGWMKGGESGPAVIPGNPQDSLLMQAVRYESWEMPPNGRLPEAEIAVLEKWIGMGAPDPRTGDTPSPAATAVDISQGRRFWAFQPPESHPKPDVQNPSWPRDELDCFVLAALENAGLSPAHDAVPAVWLRRITYDLTGLAPTPDELTAFLADSSPSAREQVVDRLLASPQFGVHWGRHWLDVARYADSNGSDFNATFYNAWRYRNYVVDSFNRDKPWDQFVREQLAGDLLPFESEQQRAEQLIATTFLMIGSRMLSERDKDKLIMDVVDEQIDTVGKAFLGMTLGCARCHDHKFDPIPTRDYYALAGIFRSTITLEGESQQYVSTWVETPLPVPPEITQEIERHRQQKDTLAGKLADSRRQLKSAEELRSVAAADSRAAESRVEPDSTLQQQITALTALVRQQETELKELEKQSPKPPAAMAAREAPQIGDCEICIRGEISHRGPAVPRGFLQVVSDTPDSIRNPKESGRRELADWITRPDHPLTARVIVNRIWQHLLGEGLVRSVDNFGRLGDLPSHPELLDTLTGQFVQSGWSVKSLIRRIALSRTYAMSTQYNEAAMQKDPDNRLLWRAHRRRLPAEALRDTMLQHGGQIDLTPGESPVAGLGALAIDNSRQDSSGRSTDGSKRSLYLPIVRNELPAFLVVFDFADPDMVTGRRPETNVPAQAMFLMNHPFVQQQAERTAARLLAEQSQTVGTGQGFNHAAFVQTVFLTLLSRRPLDTEQEQMVAFVRAIEQDDPQRRTPAWASAIQALFASTEFRMLE